VTRHTPLISALLSAAALVSGFLTTPVASAAPDTPELPWQADHWPQHQPWQDAHGGTARIQAAAGLPGPIDPQNWANPDNMTWADYLKVPGTNWVDPSKKGSMRTFRGALVLADYPNQQFVVTQPQGSSVFGNPTAEAHDIPRDQVAQFYQDFLNKPQALNHGHTLHEYWMEDSGGRYGVELTGFGPYTMPGKDHEYAMEFQAGTGCPAGDSCNRNIRTDARTAWVNAVGPEVPAGFDFVFYLSAGQDESSTWQEFGPIKFENKEDVTDRFGPPDENLPNWSRTRYVEWTSWASGSSIWPNAGGGAVIYAHEFSHILGIGDNYNNPFAIPVRRAYTGIWEMLSRGSFNGPGGPHTRFLIPPTAGASMGAQHMLRNKIKLAMVDEQNVLRLSREALAQSGVVVATVTAREINPAANQLSGINIALGTGDLAPACNVNTEPLCDGRGYQNYTVEVVDRMGSDSFTPDHGVLLAKTKNQDNAPFEWIVDANPQDIGMTDFVRPDGTHVPITIGDYRQLSDALFHAGTDSGSEFEYVDAANRLHFYVLNIQRDQQGVLSYTVAIRSLDGSGPQRRGVQLAATTARAGGSGLANCSSPLINTGQIAPPQQTGHPEDVSAYLRGDVYRLSATVEGSGWTTWLPNHLATASAGKPVQVPVYAKQNTPGSKLVRVNLTATSESDPTKTSTATCYTFGN
jgi:M6 family metalloprotease-like protein